PGRDPQREVRSWPRRRAARADPREQPVNAEAEPLKHRAEQLSVLIAVAAAPGVHELGLDRVEVYLNPAAKHYVQVLERDRRQVPPVQLGERGFGRLCRSAAGDPA